MLTAPRIPELAQRDRFVRRAVSQGRVLTLADEESASVPSQKIANRTVQLFWSSPIEAKRWAEALTGEANLQDIALTTFAADILPGLAAAKGLVGADWVADPIEAEVDPLDLVLRLKKGSVPRFLKSLADKGEVFLVADDNGPHLQTARRRGGDVGLVHVFASRSEAERYMKRSGAKRIIADPFADFLASTIPWAAARGHAIALEPIAGAGIIDVPASDFAARLAAA